MLLRCFCSPIDQHPFSTISFGLYEHHQQRFNRPLFRSSHLCHPATRMLRLFPHANSCLYSHSSGVSPLFNNVGGSSHMISMSCQSMYISIISSPANRRASCHPNLTLSVILPRALWTSQGIAQCIMNSLRQEMCPSMHEILATQTCFSKASSVVYAILENFIRLFVSFMT
jgi:hypothetical protein